MAEIKINELPDTRYDKLFFLWYFDDEEGYGIEIMGLRNNTNDNTSEKATFHSLAKWSFGHGTKARDLRRAWGDYVAEVSKSNGSVIPEEILNIKLQYSPNNELRLFGDLQKIECMLNESKTRVNSV